MAAPTFEEVAREVHARRKGLWSDGKHVDQSINTLRDYAFPLIGNFAIDRIGTPEVLKVLSPIWIEKPETARLVRQRLSVVLDWARVASHRTGDDPVQLIGEALPRHQRGEDDHHAALAYAKVPTFMAALRAGRAAPINKLAFELLAHFLADRNQTGGIPTAANSGSCSVVSRGEDGGDELGSRASLFG